MKKTYLTLAVILGIMNTAFSQTTSTGIVSLGTSMSIKIDLDQTNSLVTYTMTGPESKWFAIGLDAQSMIANTDIVRFGTSVLDQHLLGFQPPVTDTKSDLAQISNTTTNGVRTIVATRPFDTGDTEDYQFVSKLDNLNIIWAVGSSASLSNKHANKGFKSLTFTGTLGTQDFATLGDIEVFPNPSKNGMFSVSKNNLVPISKIKIFDTTARLLKSMDASKTNQTNIDISGLSKGIYFMELSNETDKTVKKIVIE
jgi:hypothetical protein